MNNKKKVKKIHPLPPHIGMNKLVVYIYTTNSATLSAIGVPDILMTTCRKVTTPTGPLFRTGGFYIENADGTCQLGLLLQV